MHKNSNIQRPGDSSTRYRTGKTATQRYEGGEQSSDEEMYAGGERSFAPSMAGSRGAAATVQKLRDERSQSHQTQSLGGMTFKSPRSN